MVTPVDAQRDDIEDAFWNARRNASLYLAALDNIVGQGAGPRTLHLSKADIENINFGALQLEQLICAAEAAWMAGRRV